MADLLLPLAAVLTFLFGWNNSSFLIGNIRGSGSATLRTSLLLIVAGLLTGVLSEGSKMSKSLNGVLAPGSDYPILLVTFAISVVLTLGLTLMNIPVSFSATMVGAFLGATYASSLPIAIPQAELVVAFWFLAPLLAGLGTYVLYRLVSRMVSNFGIVTVDSLNRIGVVASSLAVSYSLGANNIGLIYGTANGSLIGGTDALVVVALTLVAVLGILLFGRGGVTGTIGDRMLVLSPQGVVSAFISSAVGLGRNSAQRSNVDRSVRARWNVRGGIREEDHSGK
jgi:phosphate/sulfate permease